MILNMTGGGSGGADLNFKVVGGTSQPSSASENTIWVNTSTTITSWMFSATQPTSPTSGMVWISIGTSSAVAFNALKENGIQVCPIFVRQYVNGAWVEKTAKSYQSGKWEDWACVMIGDGRYNSSNFKITPVGTGASATFNSDGTMTASLSATDHQYGANLVTVFLDRKADSYNTLEVTCSASASGGYMYFGVVSSTQLLDADIVRKESAVGTSKVTLTCDISNANGYPIITPTNVMNNGAITIRIHEWKMY